MGDLAEAVKNIFRDREQKFERELQSFTTNREKIVFIRKTYPDMKAIRISEKLGISRERVRQLLAKLDLPTKIEFERKGILACVVCGIPFTHPRYSNSSGRCKDCFMASKRSIIVCFQCGKLFSMRTKDYLNRINVKKYSHIFCGHKCSGSYIAKNYGFIAHPENIRKGQKNVN